VKNLTSKQKSILQYIVDRVEDPGRFPSYREIGAAFRLRSVATVAQHLKALEEKGYLARDGNKLIVPSNLRRERGVAILGPVRAGEPLSAFANFEGHLRLEEFTRGGELFAVRVQGDSMIEEGILEGDFVLVEPSETARSGEMVVAYVGEDQACTVKRYHKADGAIELRPANARYSPIRVQGDPFFRLAGRVVGVVRRV
jgi:repressor LexA